jgi:hypothetical protein
MSNDEIKRIDVEYAKKELIPILVLMLGVLSLIPNNVLRIIISIVVAILFFKNVGKNNLEKKDKWCLNIGAALTLASFFSTISGINVLIILIIVIAAGIGFLERKMRLSGKSGENFVISVLNKLDPGQYKIINDVLLPSNGNTKTTQTDHIVVSNFGVFCIETKDYTGWIYGRANDEKWTHSFNRYDKFRFYNPLRQNYAHVKSVEDLMVKINISTPVFSFVAFPSADKLKISGTDNVGFARDILYKIKSIKKRVLSDSERDSIYEAIMAANIIDENERNNHIESVLNLK